MKRHVAPSSNPLKTPIGRTPRRDREKDPPLHEAYERMASRFGPQNWWPAESPFEVIVGAILTQNTSWKNVEKAIENLRKRGALSARTLSALPIDELAILIRSSGFFNVKARRLRAFLRFFFEAYGGDLETMFSQPPDLLRSKLLRVEGIGPETADSILLYAGGHPFFVVDRYTQRILSRHGWVREGISYEDLQRLLMSSVPADPRIYNEYHALIVRVGKDFCRKAPSCRDCPLEPLLDEGIS